MKEGEREESVFDKPVNGGREFQPVGCEFFVVFLARFGKRKIFAGWPAAAFDPAVGKQAGVFQAGEQGIKCAFHNSQVGVPHLLYDFAGIGLLPPDDGQDAELVDAFAHLALGIINVHAGIV